MGKSFLRGNYGQMPVTLLFAGFVIAASTGGSVWTAPALADAKTVDGIIKTLAEQGKKALMEKHYADAAEWFLRASIQAEREHKSERVQAGLVEMLGYSYAQAKQYSKAREALSKGYVLYESALGYGNAETARIMDQLAEIQIQEKDYEGAVQTLMGAYQRSLGIEKNVIADPKAIGYRTNRLAYVCSYFPQGLPQELRYQGAIARGQTCDDMYADTIGDLKRKEEAGASKQVVADAIKDVFVFWKGVVDKGGNAGNKAHYETSWRRIYGTSSNLANAGGAGTGGTGGTTSGGKIGGGGLGGGTGLLGGSGGTGLLGGGTTGLGGVGLGGSGAGLGAGSTPGGSDHIRPSPFGKSPANFPWMKGIGKEHSFVSGQDFGMKTLDESLKKLGVK